MSSEENLPESQTGGSTTILKKDKYLLYILCPWCAKQKIWGHLSSLCQTIFQEVVKEFFEKCLKKIGAGRAKNERVGKRGAANSWSVRSCQRC